MVVCLKFAPLALVATLAADPALSDYDVTAVCVGPRATNECRMMQDIGRHMTYSFWKETTEPEHFDCLATYPGPDILPLSYCLNGYRKQRARK